MGNRTNSTLDETEQYLQLYQELTSNVFSQDSDTGKPIILSSLDRLDALLQSDNAVVERLEGHDMTVDTVVTTEGKQFLRCHLVTLLDFTNGDKVPYKHAFEAAGGIALAAHHLNEGIGWIVPQVTGLNTQCPIRFTVEFVDTEQAQGVALKHVIAMTDRQRNQPCAFIGASSSAVSIPTAIVTGIRGYPQISPQSTSQQLEDRTQFPLFARTVPSDVDNAVPIVRFVRYYLKATHLMVLHVNNPYGNAFADDLKLASHEHTPDLQIQEHELAEHANPQLITEAIALIKDSQFTFIFVALESQIIMDQVMLEAYHQGIAGSGSHRNWFFSNTMASLSDRGYLEPDSPLVKAYAGVGRMQVSGGHAGMESFDTFACNLRTLRSSRPDLDYLASLLPQKQYNNVNTLAPSSTLGDPTTAATTRGGAMVSPSQQHLRGSSDQFTNDNTTTTSTDTSTTTSVARKNMPFIYDQDFMDPIPKMADYTSPAYEAAIALGLAACQVVANNLPMTGVNHYHELKQTSFMGVASKVAFLNDTGTRDPSTSLFAIENEVPQKVQVEINTTNGTLQTVTRIQFQSVITDMYGNGEWEHLQDYKFSDGTSNILPSVVPPPPVNHQYIHTTLKVVAGVMYVIIMILAFRCAWWTEHNKTTRVVRASQPLFLRVILLGIVIFATTIVPMNIDDRVASQQGCTIACNFYYWFMFLGFAVMFSGLFTKIYRVNQILNNPVKFKRVKVTVQDVIKPMAAIIGVNLILLTVMTAVAPSEWQIVVAETDKFGRPTETYGHCTTEKAIPYYATLGAINGMALLFSIQQAYNTRKLATEFSESRYIFYAMIGILVALFQGIPVLILVRDDPDVQDFIKCTVIFVTCSSVMTFLFVPKMRYLVKRQKKSKGMRQDENVHVSGLEPNGSGHLDGSARLHGSGNINYSTVRQRLNGSGTRPVAISGLSNISGLSGCSNTSGNSSEEEGIRFTKLSHEELQDENKKLRKKLQLLNCDLGTLATDNSVSAESGSSSGMKIISRKSQFELMQENKQLKKMVKKALKKNCAVTAQATINEEEKESENEDLNLDDDSDHEANVERQVTGPERQVSFNLPPLAKFPIESTDHETLSSRDAEAANGMVAMAEATESKATTTSTEEATMVPLTVTE